MPGMQASPALFYSRLVDLANQAANPLPGAQVEGMLPLHQATMPLTGFMGVQRPHDGGFATWLNQTVNLGGLEWLIPLLTPNQSPEDLAAMLKDMRSLTPEQHRRISDRAVDFGLEQERAQPGTFAKYPTSVE